MISRLVFLKTRTASHHAASGSSSFTGADLESCGGGGWVRFWSTAKSALLSEFIAHPHASNVIATTDAENKFLVTGKQITLTFNLNISNGFLTFNGSWPGSYILTAPQLRLVFSDANKCIFLIHVTKFVIPLYNSKFIAFFHMQLTAKGQ